LFVRARGALSLSVRAGALHDHMRIASSSVHRLGSVDLGILAETTPLVWRGELWLLECIQGGRYYGRINYTSYPNLPQPVGYLRFTNPRKGVKNTRLVV